MTQIGRGALVLLAVLTAAPMTFAQAPSPEVALAQSLFDQARGLMAEERWSEACPKLEESQRIDPAGGTLLNLARCYEGAGRLATAWATFKDALSTARNEGRADRAQEAEERIRALDPRVPKITLLLASAAAGTTVKDNDNVIAEVAWNHPVPVDPGQHRIVVQAPGRVGWQVTVGLRAGEKRELRVPELMSAPATAPGAPTARAQPAPHAPPQRRASVTEDRSAGSTQRTIGYVVGGVGAVAVLLGSYFGVRAFVKKSQSDSARANGQCNDTCAGAWEDGRTAASRSNVAFAVGGVALGFGMGLVLSAPSAAPPAAGGAPRGAQVDVGGTF
jgi:hypothetical protein